MRSLFLILLFTIAQLSANGDLYCDESIYEIINNNEKHPKMPDHYPFLISFNKDKDAAAVKKIIADNWLDKRTLDCKNIERCEAVTLLLIENNITNLDLGAFQINYAYHAYYVNEYFDNQAAKRRVCGILLSLSESYGWSYKTIARYHSSKPEHNERYRSRLVAHYEKIQQTTIKEKR